VCCPVIVSSEKMRGRRIMTLLTASVACQSLIITLKEHNLSILGLAQYVAAPYLDFYLVAYLCIYAYELGRIIRDAPMGAREQLLRLLAPP
jgi:hypothetical protein